MNAQELVRIMKNIVLDDGHCVHILYFAPILFSFETMMNGLLTFCLLAQLALLQVRSSISLIGVCVICFYLCDQKYH